MNVYVPKNRVMSRRSGQRRDFPESYIYNVATLGQRCDVPKSYICNVATFGPKVLTLQRGLPFHVATLIPTSRRSREVFFPTSRH